ncbi:MAG: AtpZ/AtpI family protein [Thermoplasmata archaeon]|nr:AtpZ/AtpI family protein [Thermoplasmata archaeon]
MVNVVDKIALRRYRHVDKSLLKYFRLIGEVGFTLCLIIGGSLLLGIFLDRKLGTPPVFSIVLGIMGVGAAFVRITTLLIPDQEKEKETKNNGKGSDN